MKKLLTASVLAMMSATTFAADYSPNYGNASSVTGNDSFRSRDGSSCTASVLGPTLNIGAASQAGSERIGATNEGGHSNTVFATISIPLGADSETRLDCTRLYEIELERAALELQQLKQAVEQQKMELQRAQEAAAKGQADAAALFADEPAEEAPAEDLFGGAQPETKSEKSVSIKDLIGDK